MLLGRHRHQRLIHSPHHLLNTKHQYSKRLHRNPNLHRNHQCAYQRQVDQVMLR